MFLASIPSAIHAWRNRRQVTAELGEIRRREQPFDDLETDRNLTIAVAALERNDRREAERLWVKVYTANPARVADSADGLRVALGLRHFDEAEAMMAGAMKRSPNKPAYAEGYAAVAQARKDLEEAVKRWQVVLRKFPDYATAWSSVAVCLRELGRLDDADATLERAFRRSAHQTVIRMEHARVAAARRDWPEAFKRWELVRTRFNHPAAHVGMAEAAREMGRLDEARDILRQARFRFPIHPGPAIGLAQVAQAGGDPAEILECWTVVRDRFPMMPLGHMETSKLLVAAGRVDEAEAVLRDAADRFKDNPFMLSEYARIAHNRQDWPEANRRWEMMRTRFPNLADGYRRGAEALDALGQAAEAQAVRAALAKRSGG